MTAGTTMLVPALRHERSTSKDTVEAARPAHVADTISSGTRGQPRVGLSLPLGRREAGPCG